MNRVFKIAMILDNEFTGDLRVENEVISLQQAGFKVYVLCLNHGKKKEVEDFYGAKILRIPLSRMFMKKMRGLVNSPIDPYTWFWRKHLIELVRKEKIHAIHVHDLYLVGAALSAKKRLKRKIPVVADLHENYPEALKNYSFINKFPAKYLISIRKWRRTERKWLRETDHVITVIEEAVTRYSRLGVNPDKISVVANYVNAEQFLLNEKKPENSKKRFGKFTAIYIGGFDIHRGLEAIINATKIITERIPDFKLLLVGSGVNKTELQNLAIENGVSDSVMFTGWLNPSKLPVLIQNSDVGLIPHLKSPHTDNTIPHKLFQYMLMTKPVLVSNCDPLERIVSETNCGLVFESGNAEDFANKIFEFVNNPDMMEKMGQRGLKAVEDKYNWNKTADKLIDIYSKMKVKAAAKS